MNRVAQNIGLDQRLQCSPVHHVTWTVEELVDVEFQPGVLKDAHRSVLVELYQHVDVTFRAASPRATEPNTAACATPSRRKSVSWARSVSSAFWRSSLIAHHEFTRRCGLVGSVVNRAPATAPSARIHEDHPGGEV